MEKIFVIFLIVPSVFFDQFILNVHSYSVHGIAEHHKRHHRESSPNMWTILGQTVKSENSDPLSEYMDNEYDNMLHEKSVEYHNQKTSSGSGDTSGQTGGAGSPHCPKCRNRPEIHMTQEQLTELRIKYVKNQILKKLKLKERPQVSISGLPKPVADGITIMADSEDDFPSGIQDDYYAKTTQKVIFPQIDSDQCKEMEELGSSMCFSIQIPADIDHRDIESAELWVYKQPHIMDADKHSFLIGEIETWDAKHVIKPFAIHETNVTEDWVKVDIAWQIQKWIEYNDLYHVIDISCNTCEKHPSLDLFSLDNGYRPFIVVNTHSNRKIKRQKRSINCSAGVTECCRENLYISFAEIGWGDWIIQPPGYHAYFCRGSCASAATISLSGSHYNSVLRKVIYKQNSLKTKKLELVPCCTATQFSSLQLFYMDSNNTVTQKTLPNMVVEACGCM